MSSATVVRCVTWTPFHDCGPRSSQWITAGPSVQRPGLGRRAAASPADPDRRPDAERQEGGEPLKPVPADPDLLDAQPLSVGEAAVGDGQVLADQAPEEAVEVLRLPLRAGQCSAAGNPRFRRPDRSGRRTKGQEAGLADGPVHRPAYRRNYVATSRAARASASGKPPGQRHPDRGHAAALNAARGGARSERPGAVARSGAGRRPAHRHRHPGRRHRPPKPISSGTRGEAAPSRHREVRWR